MDPQPHDVFFHIRMVMSMVTGLGVARILAGLARFVQHPGKERIYGPHLAWSLFLLLAILHFWWFEFALAATPEWSFARYLFVVGYAVLFFFIAVLLFPDSIAEYDGFAGYFHARQAWFYGFLALLFAVDAADAALKGSDHLAALGGGLLCARGAAGGGGAGADAAEGERAASGSCGGGNRAGGGVDRAEAGAALKVQRRA